MNLDTLEKLARAATPGPWVHSEQRGLPGHCFVAQVFIGDDDGCSLAKLDATVDPRNASADAAFIAAANPAAILELIDSHRKLSDLLGRAFGAIIRDSDGKLLSEAMSALNKANGESNER